MSLAQAALEYYSFFVFSLIIHHYGIKLQPLCFSTWSDIFLKQVVFVLQAKYVAECLDEIKSELRQENIAVKAIAVNKLNYVSTVTFLYM